MDTLNTLLAGENEDSVDDAFQYEYSSETKPVHLKSVPVTKRALYEHLSLSDSDDTQFDSEHLGLPRSRPLHRAYSNDQTKSCTDGCSDDEQKERETSHGIAVHDQRTILITNLTERTAHKDIAGIVRGGRLLDIFLRNDRSATVSFVEGAAEFLAYVKRNDIYLHAKRVCFIEMSLRLSG